MIARTFSTRRIRVLRRPFVTGFRSAQRFDRRDHHQAVHSVGKLRIERDERVLTRRPVVVT